MRLRSLEADNFRAVTKARLTFGPGLNVLFGANDLGKSTLAEAVRAALLVSFGAAEHRSFIPWGTSLTPRTAMVFEVGTAVYRVEKTFGPKGQAYLYLEQGDRFVKKIDGRGVDGELRTLLSWGVPPPGGKGPQKRTTAYLTTALLARQGEVGSILEANIDEDLEESGRTLVTQALGALGQDPRVSRLIERLKEDIEPVFQVDGKHRSRADSPLVIKKKEIEARERRLRELEDVARRSDEVQQQVQRLVATRDQKAEGFEAARTRLEGLLTQTQVAKARRELEQQIDLLAKENARAAEASAALARAKQEIDDARTDLEKREIEHGRASEVFVLAEKALHPIRNRVASATAAVEQSGELAQRSRETRDAKLSAERDAATRRVSDAHELERLDTRHRELAAKLAQAEAAQVEAQGRIDRATALAKYVDLRARRGEAIALVDGLREAEQEHNRCRGLEVSSRVDLGTADAALDLARHELESAREQSTDSERALPEQTLRANLLQCEASQRAAQELAMRASDATESTKRASEAERELADLETKLGVLVAAAEDNKRELDAGATQIRECERMALALRRNALRRQIDELSQQATLAREARANAATLLSRAKEVVRPLSNERLADLRRLNDQIQAPPPGTTSRTPVASTLLLAVVVGASTWIALAMAARVPGAEAIAVAAALVTAAIRLLIHRSSTRPELSRRMEREHLQKRWASEVEPVLKEAHVADVDALEEACRRAEQESTKLRAEAADQETAAELAQTTSVSLASLRLEFEGLEWVDADDENRLVSEASKFAGREAISRELTQCRSTVERLRGERDRILEERNAVASQLATARARVESARSDRDRALAMVPDPSATRADAIARVAEEQARIDGIRGELAALGAAISDAADLASKRRAEAEAELIKRSEALETKRAAHEANARLAAAASVRWEIARTAAAAVDVGRLDRELTELAPQIGSAVSEFADRDTAEAEVVRARESASQLFADREALKAAATEARTRAHELAIALGAPASELLVAAEQTIARIDLELGTPLDGEAAAASAAVELKDAADQLQHVEAKTLLARQDEQAARHARDEARGRFERARGDLEAREHAAKTAGRPEASVELSTATEALAKMSVASAPAADQLERARLDHERLENELRHVEAELQQARGELRVVGGLVAAEQRDDEKEALARLCESRDELELNYAAARLLLTTLEEAEGTRAQHLGRCLAKPVTERFLDLTRGRYSGINLDRGLRAQGVVAAGEAHDLELLSMGTREQIATLIRLAVAAQIKSVLVLDDQLVQSDPERLAWFRGQLRRSAVEHGHQIVVLTCRPNDYVAVEELPQPGQERFSSADGMLTTINLDVQLARAGRSAT